MKLSMLVCCVSALLVSVFAHAAVSEQAITIPFKVKGLFGESQRDMAGNEFRPDGDGPFPLLLINHGVPRSSADDAKMEDGYEAHARLFARLGFVVINPMRPGYGKSGGSVIESYHNCDNPDYYGAGIKTADSIEAAIEYAKTRPYIDTSRVVLVGQSGGGFGVLALASESRPGVLGVINFAGGRGSRGPEQVCREDKLVSVFNRYAKTTHVPMLWFYSENDHFFFPALAQRLYGAYQSENVDVQFVTAPPFRKDGHGFFHSIDTAPVWMRDVAPFLRKIGFPVSEEQVKEVLSKQAE